jgi:hypothetical protein
MSTTITFAQIKPHLSGAKAWIDAALDDVGYDDNYVNTKVIPAAIRGFEQETGFRINCVQCSSLPDGVYTPVMATGAFGSFGGVGGLLPSLPEAPVGPYGLTLGAPMPEGTPYVIESPYDFYGDMGDKYLRMPLKNKPVIQVQRARLCWNVGQPFFQMSQLWLHWDWASGEYWVLPFAGIGMIGQACIALQVVNMVSVNGNEIPGIISIDYVAGLSPTWQADPQWSSLEWALEECITYKVLCQIAETFDAGTMSVSNSAPGGFNQTRAWSRFQQRKAELQQSYKDFGKTLTKESGSVVMGFG